MAQVRVLRKARTDEPPLLEDGAGDLMILSCGHRKRAPGLLRNQRTTCEACVWLAARTKRLKRQRAGE